MYNKAVRNRADKLDLDDLRKYVDQQDRALHHRVTGVEKRVDDGISELNKDVKEILKLLTKK